MPARPRAGLPPFVTLPEVVRDAGVNELPGQGAGLLGGRYAPLLFEADTRRGDFPPPDLFGPADPDVGRLDGRRACASGSTGDQGRGHLIGGVHQELGCKSGRVLTRARTIFRAPSPHRLQPV